ncbi:MAG: GtrA family protein [Bryobacterales bacterium]|nr:GtrA family protein [Bryobacterales bacterium]
MLRSRDSGYEFELDMLIAAKQLGVGFRQVGIETVYIEGNASSHFNPILDSMRIYFVLLRFSFASVLTAVCDNLLFFAVLSWLGAPLPAQVAARLAAVVLHFNLNKRIVFLFRGQGNPVMHRYLGVVAVSGVISYLSLMSLHQMAGVPVITAKILVEGILFLANFVLLRDLVFTSKRQTAVSTDWTAYYKSVPWTARLTRRYTSRCILQALRLAGFGPGRRRPEVYEFGGGNSCFLEPIAAGIRPASYHVVDTNPLGLDLLRRRTADATLPVVLHQDDVLRLDAPKAADVVFSVGLIEHFEPSGTARCVSAHFDTVKPGGWVLVSFPTPTWLYRFIRGALELAGLWKFQDERPLDRDEVMRAAGSHAELVWEKTLWPLGLTQHMMLFRKTVKRSEAGWQAFTLPVTVARESDPARHRQRAHTEPGGEIDGLHHEELAPGVRQ